MPFMRMDPEAYDEMAAELEHSGVDVEMGERPSGEWEYSEATERFSEEGLTPISRLVLAAVRSAGAVEFRVRYDGGYDEGFTHPESFRVGAELRPATAVAQEVASGQVVEAIRAAARKDCFDAAGGRLWDRGV